MRRRGRCEEVRRRCGGGPGWASWASTRRVAFPCTSPGALVKPRAAALRLRARVRAWAYRTRKRGLLSRWTRWSAVIRGRSWRRGVQQGPAGGVAAEGGGVLDGRYGPDVDLERRRRGRGAVGVDADTEDGCPGRVGLVLAGSTDEGALGAKDPGDGVSGDDGAYLAGVVELYEFPGGLVDDPVPRTTPQDLDDECLLPAAIEGDVEEAGPGDVDVGDAFRVREVRPQDLGDLLRRTAGGAGQLQGDVRGVVPAPAGPRRRRPRPAPAPARQAHPRPPHGARRAARYGRARRGSRDKRRGGGGWVGELVWGRVRDVDGGVGAVGCGDGAGAGLVQVSGRCGPVRFAAPGRWAGPGR